MVQPSNITPASTPPPPSEAAKARGGGIRVAGGGRGRVLGPGKVALSPAIQARTSSAPYGGALSPSASTVSLNSTFSDGGAFGVNGVGGSNGVGMAIGMGERSSTMPPGGLIICPICSEQMVTLLQLNRHIDDAHREVEEEEKDDVKTWFRKRVMKAKQFQPVLALNQKLKGLDIFESNAVVASSPPTNGVNGTSHTTPAQDMREPDEFVTRAHWQKPGSNDVCVDPTCRKPLGVVNGCVNCRKCGKLFCEEHTMYQIKLSRSAQHEPVRGFWCRVCETCFKSREGYNDVNGFTRDHTALFKSHRQKSVDRVHLEITRLEKRLTKLTQLLANPPPLQNDPTTIWPVTGIIKNQKRQLEQMVVAWEDDAGVTNCPYCKQTFSKLGVAGVGIRKHHCRLCGKVVCGDTRTGCSEEVGLNVTNLSQTRALSEKAMNETNIDVRMCKECKVTIFSKKDFVADISVRTADIRAYATLIQFEQGITAMLPRFHTLLQILQDAKSNSNSSSSSSSNHKHHPHPLHPHPTPAQLAEATRTRKRMLDAFAQYESAAKRIRDLPTTSPTQKLLQKNIYQAAAQFLQQNMLPLKSLPRLIKSSSRSSNSSGTNSPARRASMLEDGFGGGVGSGVGSGASSVVSAAELEERRLKEQIMVLEEQKFLVEGMLADAQRQRRFDEVGALGGSLKELEEEIGKVREAVERLEVE